MASSIICDDCLIIILDMLPDNHLSLIDVSKKVRKLILMSAKISFILEIYSKLFMRNDKDSIVLLNKRYSIDREYIIGEYLIHYYNHLGYLDHWCPTCVGAIVSPYEYALECRGDIAFWIYNMFNIDLKSYVYNWRVRKSVIRNDHLWLFKKVIGLFDFDQKSRGYLLNWYMGRPVFAVYESHEEICGICEKAFYGSLNIIKYVLESGITSIGGICKKIFKSAIRGGHSEMVKYLCQRPNFVMKRKDFSKILKNPELTSMIISILQNNKKQLVELVSAENFINDNFEFIEPVLKSISEYQPIMEPKGWLFNQGTLIFWNIETIMIHNVTMKFSIFRSLGDFINIHSSLNNNCRAVGNKARREIKKLDDLDLIQQNILHEVVYTTK